MLSFYQKLASKLNETGSGLPFQDSGASSAGGGKSASFKATGERIDPSRKVNAPNQSGAPAQDPSGDSRADPAPEGTDPLDIDLFQSESRMVIIAQLPGVSKTDFEITIDEESNTVTVQATQKRPDLPPLPPSAGAEAQKNESEKGRYAKQETKWKTLYRKIYLPAPFDGGESGAFLDRGVLVIVLPSKRPGAGKKLAVKEISDETRESQPQK